MDTTRNARGTSSSVQYEDIQLKFERKEEKGANILQIYLPGFYKEQLRIVYTNSSRTLRITGERSLANNKCIRFNQVFPVPQNSEVNKIQAKFQVHDEMLIITIPKATLAPITAPGQKTGPTKNTTQEAPIEAGPATSATTMTSSHMLQTAAPCDPEMDKGMRDRSRDGSTSTSTDSKKQVAGKNPEACGREEGSRDTKTVTGKSYFCLIVGSSSETTPMSNTNGAAENRITEQVMEKFKTVLDELDQEIKKWSKISLVDDDREKKGTNDEFLFREKVKELRRNVASALEKIAKGLSDINMKELSRNVASAVERIVKGLRDLDMEQMSDDRKTMINAGVAVLVIVASGAYIHHSFRAIW